MRTERLSVLEAWDRFPELRDRFDSISGLGEYRAVVLREVVRPEVVERWLEGERGYLDSPEYDVLVEFPPEPTGWVLLDTGGHVYVAVKDMDVAGLGTVAVGVSSDAVVLHGRPYDEDWEFLGEHREWWPLADEGDVRAFLESSGGWFSAEQQEEVLAQWRAIREF